MRVLSFLGCLLLSAPAGASGPAKRTADGGHAKLQLRGYAGGKYTLDYGSDGPGQQRFHPESR